MRKYYFFDLDNTLYSPELGILRIMEERIKEYLQRKTKLSLEEIGKLRDGYQKTYGCTFSGVVNDLKYEPTEFLTYVHDIPKNSYPEEDKKLRKILKEIDGTLFIATNSYKPYATRVLKSIGIYDLFEDIFDVIDFGYVYKNSDKSYKSITDRLNIKGCECVMIDDVWKYLIKAKEHGFLTVLVNHDEPQKDPDFHITDIYKISQVVADIKSREAKI